MLIFSYLLVLTCFLGAHKKRGATRLIEMILLSTHNVCFGWEMSEFNF